MEKITIDNIDASIFKEDNKYIYLKIIPLKGEIKINVPYQIKDEDIALFIKNNAAIINKYKDISISENNIITQVYDSGAGYKPIYAFGTKSEIGAAPTLLNASSATNFVYEVDNISDRDIEVINGIESRQKIKDRMKMLAACSDDVVFNGLVNDVFYGNLMLIDTSFPRIMAEALKISFLEDISGCKSVVEKLEERDPLRYPRKGLYEYKFKKFLCAVALGLMPARFWDGIDDANGGYIIVKRDGEVLAYYIYNRSAFESYLLNNTKFEKGSTTRHNYASLYKEENKVLLNLNLSIRFM